MARITSPSKPTTTPRNTVNPKNSSARRPCRFAPNIQQMKQYVWQVVKSQKPNNFIKLPSVKALNGHFQVQAEEILLTLEKLRGKGFDYEIINGTEPILVWNTDRLAS